MTKGKQPTRLRTFSLRPPQGTAEAIFEPALDQLDDTEAHLVEREARHIASLVENVGWQSSLEILAVLGLFLNDATTKQRKAKSTT